MTWVKWSFQYTTEVLKVTKYYGKAKYHGTFIRCVHMHKQTQTKILIIPSIIISRNFSTLYKRFFRTDP